MPFDRGTRYCKWAKGERGRFSWRQKEGADLDLEGLTILRRKNILEAEKYPSDRETLSVCEGGLEGLWLLK